MGALADGGAADLDGDGTLDVSTTTDALGHRTRTFTEPDGSTLVVTYVDADHLTAAGDLNGDGTVDLQIAQTHTSGSTVVEERQQDTDFDSNLDATQTRTYDLGAQTLSVHTTAPVIEPDGGLGTTATDYTSSLHMNAGSCDELDGFPSLIAYTGHVSFPFGSGVHVAILDDGSSNTCTSAQGTRVAHALQNAVNDALHCLAAANPELHAELVSALADRGWTLSCTSACTAALATTDLGGDFTDPNSWFGETLGNQRTGLNMNAIGDDDGALEDVLIHEMLHWAGDPHDDASTESNGHDQVYGCGRYCSKCPGAASTVGAGNAAADCARCSDAAHKADCGIVTAQQNGGCPQDVALCHAGLGGNSPCDSCQNSVDQYCDGSSIPGQLPSFVCCNSCPSGYGTPDISCNANPAPASCDGTPPFCQ